jgi:4-aminobutyrate aminotransferase-like enzyme
MDLAKEISGLAVGHHPDTVFEAFSLVFASLFVQVARPAQATALKTFTERLQANCLALEHAYCVATGSGGTA